MHAPRPDRRRAARSRSSILRSFSASPSSILATGMPVQLAERRRHVVLADDVRRAVLEARLLRRGFLRGLEPALDVGDRARARARRAWRKFLLFARQLELTSGAWRAPLRTPTGRRDDAAPRTRACGCASRRRFGSSSRARFSSRVARLHAQRIVVVLQARSCALSDVDAPVQRRPARPARRRPRTRLLRRRLVEEVDRACREARGPDVALGQASPAETMARSPTRTLVVGLVLAWRCRGGSRSPARCVGASSVIIEKRRMQAADRAR